MLEPYILRHLFNGQIQPKYLNMITNLYLRYQFGSIEFLEQLLVMCAKQSESQDVNLHSVFKLLINLDPKNFKGIP